MKMLIGGKWAEALNGETFSRRSPGNGLEVGIYPEAGSEDVDQAVAAARSAFDTGHWPYMPAEHRARILTRTAELIRQNADRIALLEALESGKVISQARAEMDWSANLWDYCAGVARTLHGDSHNNLGPNLIANVMREPIGVVSIITPWNFPLLIISQKLPFALAAGCTAVVKPSEFTPATTLILGELLIEAGLPEGVVNIVTGHGRPAGHRMLDHPGVDMISFTGSTAVGKVAVQSSAQQLKKVSLELGGKNAQIVFADANLEEAADAIIEGAFKNAGESCNCGARLLVERSVHDELVQRVLKRARSVKVGDPLDPDSQIGAIISPAQLDKIVGFVSRARESGADVLLGEGRIPSSDGLYIYPSILTGVDPQTEVANSEIFGPVLSVIPFDTAAEAVAIANQTDFGLSAAVWTSDYERAVSMTRRLQAGTIWVNTYSSGPAELPFGGYKQSGIGRENGRAGVEEFTELKTVQFYFGGRQAWWVRGQR
ncbi:MULTISPECIES: aldehyde dehydrogenase family protein [Mesorhizobium]|uniref:aldehyde dehydrogenase family protein n=1 Tax=Mesorhizobium TaxID=68287 RepID=UPI0007ED4A0A|nr:MULTISPECIES: aldehyde dehydrogenase family protein [Mesorhizobium]PBB52937.1 sorbosone dehydrogenase [Mesorhizobium loti]QIA22529.1 aldehyde dehydrogenase family protein [Mesorhizobium sp. AA22]